MKRFFLVLIVLILTATSAYAEDVEHAAVLAALQASYPGLTTAVIDQWGHTAAAALAHQGKKVLCILDKQADVWHITLQNPNVLAREEPLPSLLLDSDTALFWTYNAYPIVRYTVFKTDGVWGAVNQMAQTMSGNGETTEDEIVYQDGEIIHNWYHFDQHENMLASTSQRLPAPWLSDCARLAGFDIDRFPAIGSVEYDGQWPSTAFIQQAASYWTPGYTFVSGSYASGRLRFLMDKPDGTRVFVGCGTGSSPTLVESAPLPKDTDYGVENFTNSLGICGLCVSLAPYEKDGDNWGIFSIDPYVTGMDALYFGPNCVLMNHLSQTRICVGESPYSDIARIDWTTLPKTFQEAADSLDGDGWALVNNPNPADRLHLRESPDTRSASLGKYYNGTPVKVIEGKNDWVKVDVFGRAGWMMKKYLDLTQPHDTTLSAMPLLQFRNGTALLYDCPDDADAYQALTDSYGMFVVGLLGDEWYHIWFPASGVTGFIRQGELSPGNG